MPSRITHNFSLEEFACRDGTPYPMEWIHDRLRFLCQDLEVIRASLRTPIYINSGYRTPDYNASIGGARRSQHLEGRAADIRAVGVPSSWAFNHIRGLIQRGELQHIKGLGGYQTFTHVDIRPGRLVVWHGTRTFN